MLGVKVAAPGMGQLGAQVSLSLVIEEEENVMTAATFDSIELAL